MSLMTANVGGARRSNLRCIGLELLPTSRHLAIETNDDRIETYIRTSYSQLVRTGARLTQQTVQF